VSLTERLRIRAPQWPQWTMPLENSLNCSLSQRWQKKCGSGL
jgi:hypothetical protein